LSSSTYGRQRAIHEEGHLLLVLHKPPGPDESRREGVLFWRAPTGEWLFNRGGPGPGGLQRHVQSYADLETQLSQTFEQTADLHQVFELLEALTPLVRAARNLHLTLQSAREAVKSDPFLIEVRDRAYDVERNLELLLEDVRNSIQFRMAREAEAQARFSRDAVVSSHRLNILAALFLPPTAITSLFGMNLAHGLSERNPVWFWMVFVGGVALGVLLKGWVTVRPQRPS